MTDCHETNENVTRGHTASHGVTPIQPCLTSSPLSPPKGGRSVEGETGREPGASSPLAESPAKPKPRTRRPAALTPEQAERFARFWSVYPRRVKRADAERVWAGLNPDEALTAKIVFAVREQERRVWGVPNGEKRPHPTTWLNAGRWDDELPPAPNGNGALPLVTPPTADAPHGKIGPYRYFRAGDER